MSKPIKILLIVLGVLIIVGAIATAFWFGQKSRSNSKLNNVPEAWTEQSDKKSTGANTASNQLDPQKLSYETFTTADSQISLKYPKDWIKSEIGNPSSVISQEIVDKYKIKYPLLVSLSSSDKLIQISLMYYEFKAGQTPAQVIAELLETAKTQGATAEEVDQKDNPAISVIESKYAVKDLKLRVKEKMLFLPVDSAKQPTYIASISVLEKDWQDYAGIANFILDSAKLTKANGTEIPASSVGTATQTVGINDKKETSTNTIDPPTNNAGNAGSGASGR